MESPSLRIAYLADHEDVLPRLVEWFEAEWPAYYGAAGPGDAWRDLQEYAGRGELPVGFIATCGETACGFAALKADSVASHRHLTPWAAAGLVRPEYRGRGIGTALLQALESEARRRGYPRIYCATNTADRLLQRRGWEVLEEIRVGAEDLRVYQKVL
jgi:GNAT superfamily N-acetyltransferase